MGEPWKAANERMACLDCGESGAQAYVTTKGASPGLPVRVCGRCLDRWEWLGLRPRDPMHEEPGAKAENCCEHGDHEAPPSQRFCSKACQDCECAEGNEETGECAGICLPSKSREPKP